jgi:hypothetical protein
MKQMIGLSAAVLALVALTASSYAQAQFPKTASPAGAKVYFIEPKDGATIKGQVKIVMGLSGMGIAPAGIDSPDTGHHHVLVDVEKLDTNVPIPTNEGHRHFGRGQTETTLDLPAGKHTLQLVLGDRNHIPHNPPVMSEKITVTVTK